jgi:hypothetical protein
MIDWTQAPESGMRETIVAALKLMHERTPAAPIVEIGTSRNKKPHAMMADGWATRVFAWYAAEAGGSVVTIDPRRVAIRASEEICAPWKRVVRFVCDDAVTVAPSLPQAGLIYMDGPGGIGLHLRIYRALAHRPGLILYDNVPVWPLGDYKGKGSRSIPAMLEDGYRLVWQRAGQALLEAP